MNMFSSKRSTARHVTMVDMCVHMDCKGCENKIRKALYRLEGVEEVDIDMVRQKVSVTGYVDQRKVLKAVRKTGRRAVLWPCPYNAEYQNYTQDYYNGQHHVALASADPYYYSSAPSSSSSSSYNYNKHGYCDSTMYGYYQRPAYASVVDERAGSIFSDENPNACSIM